MFPPVSYTFLYSFTFTLLPLQFKNIAEVQYDNSVYVLKELLKSLKDLTLVAELTKNFNIHFHACGRLPIVSRNSVKSFVDKFRKSKIFGFINVKQVEDENGWYKYIFKDVKQTYEAIGRPPIALLGENALKYLQTAFPDLCDPCYHGYFIE